MPSLRHIAAATLTAIAQTKTQYPDLFKLLAGGDMVASPPASLEPGEMGILHADQLSYGEFCTLMARYPRAYTVRTENGAYCGYTIVPSQVSPNFGAEVRFSWTDPVVLSNLCDSDLVMSSAIVKIGANNSLNNASAPESNCDLTVISEIQPLAVGEHIVFNATLDQGNITCYGETQDRIGNDSSMVLFNGYEAITSTSGPLLRENLNVTVKGAAIDITPEKVWNASTDNKFMATNLGPHNVVLSCFQVSQQAKTAEQETSSTAS
ncbi:MAG: hypothetical protein K0R66_1478 [Gammaproteobacteria bacterium]|jgi:hypothetical protein|nr:hypothetical protein [Gammaproteobacteria bacterium]